MDVTNDGVDRMRQAYDVFAKDQRGRLAYKLLEDMFGDSLNNRVTIRVSKNIKLFRLYQTSACEKFIDIKLALKKMTEEQSKQKILIHFTELDLYGVFTPEQYYALTTDLAEKVFEGENITFQPKQIVLSGLPQKLIFICLGDENIVEKIRGYVKRKYNCDISYIKTNNRIEITVQGVGGNTYEEAQKSYHDLFDFINTKQSDPAVAGDLLPMPVVKSSKREYVVADISHDVSKHLDMKELISVLKTIHGENVVINLIIGNGNIINNNNNKNTSSSIKDIAKRWIENNPPKHHEPKSEYYLRYKKDNPAALADNSFGKYVLANPKYSSGKTGNVRYWIVGK